MIRLSRLSDYAVLLLCAIADEQSSVISAAALAKKIPGVGEPTVMKVLKLLTQHGILQGSRGAYGGYCLKKSLSDISVFDVVRAIDGPVAMTLCTNADEEICQFESSCVIKCGWNRVNLAIQNTLKQFSIKEFMHQPTHRAML